MKIENFKKFIRELVEEVLTTDDAHSSIENDPKVKLASRELAKAKIKKSEAEGRAAGAELTALKSTKSQTPDPDQKRELDTQIKNARIKKDLKQKEKTSASAEYSSIPK